MITVCSPWATEADLCSPCLGEAAYADMSTYLEQASELLYHLSGQQFPGICIETIAPCSKRYQGVPSQYEPFISIPLRHTLTLDNPFPWTGCGCSGADDPCSCARFSSIELPRSPVVSVDEVIIDGYPLDPSSYELRSPYLIRIDGEQWPCCDDSFTISYTYGNEPPISGIRAAAVLACELMLACDPDVIPDAKCRLPRNISAISRQGVSVIFERLTRTDGPFRFGIWEIDIFLEAFNPHGVDSPSVILNPDDFITHRRVP